MYQIDVEPDGRNPVMRVAIIATICLIASQAAAEVHILDGDTLHLDGRRHRLFAIDSPERGEPGALEAADNLRKLAARGTVSCAFVHAERGGTRDVSLCSAAGVDFSIAQVRDGHAVVWCSFARRYSDVVKQQYERASRFHDESLWEETKTRGDYAIKRLIDSALDGTSVTCVLVGHLSQRSTVWL